MYVMKHPCGYLFILICFLGVAFFQVKKLPWFDHLQRIEILTLNLDKLIHRLKHLLELCMILHSNAEQRYETIRHLLRVPGFLALLSSGILMPGLFAHRWSSSKHWFQARSCNSVQRLFKFFMD